MIFSPLYAPRFAAAVAMPLLRGAFLHAAAFILILRRLCLSALSPLHYASIAAAFHDFFRHAPIAAAAIFMPPCLFADDAC